jgi:hypothetical protein
LKCLTPPLAPQSTAEQFALAKQRAMSEGKAETVKYDQLPPDQAEVKRR